MTSTTSCFLPAASRAGNAEYSPDTSASLSAADSSESPSFDELCPKDQGRGETNTSETAEREPKTPDADADSVESTDTVIDPTEDLEEEKDDESPEVAAVPVLESPSIIQTLLASLGGVTALAGVSPVQGDPAENAATVASTPTTSGAAVRADGRNGSSPQDEGQVSARVSRRQGRVAAATDGQTHEGSSTRNRPSPAASPRATDKESATTASPVAIANKAKTTPSEDTSAQPTVARLINAKGHAEKSAGQALVQQAAQMSVGQNKFLSADGQEVANVVRSAGTRTALSAGTMSSSTNTATARHAETPVLATNSPSTTGQGTWTEGLSVDWKGWTNGGGERSSSAAQFSQLGEKLGQIGVATTPATAAVARTATPVVPQAAPAAPTVPADAAEALAPIHSAIERLVLHGRDQLALTVRFEQGGSLSIKLAMNQGEIATQIQTDVPGLEAALKSSWGELAQDWNSRGWKLGHPEFTSSTATYHQREDATADGRNAGRQARENADEAPAFGGRAFSPARLKHAGAVTLSGLDALRAAALARRGIHTWA